MSLRNEVCTDQRYLDEAPAPKYADHGTRDNDKLFAYRYERQRLGAQKTGVTNASAGTGARTGEVLARESQGDTFPEPASSASERGSALTHLYAMQNDASAHDARGERAPRAVGVPVPSRVENAQSPTQAESTQRPVGAGAHGDLSARAEVRATCVSCLSADSMSRSGEGIFCSTCNKAALMPRVAALVPP